MVVGTMVVGTIVVGTTVVGSMVVGMMVVGSTVVSTEVTVMAVDSDASVDALVSVSSPPLSFNSMKSSMPQTMRTATVAMTSATTMGVLFFSGGVGGVGGTGGM